jgi:hypothetical protein
MNYIQNAAARNFINAYTNRSLSATPSSQYTLDSTVSAEAYRNERQALEGLVASDESLDDDAFNNPGQVQATHSHNLSLKARQEVTRNLEFSQEGTRLKAFETTQITNRYEDEADHTLMLSGYELDSQQITKVSVVPSRDGGITVVSTVGNADAITVSQYDVPVAEVMDWYVAK